MALFVTSRRHDTHIKAKAKEFASNEHRLTECFVTIRNWCWVAGAGPSRAKEAPGFRAGALQPRPPPKLDYDEARGQIDFHSLTMAACYTRRGLN
jgi:hypothetical protein